MYSARALRRPPHQGQEIRSFRAATDAIGQDVPFQTLHVGEADASFRRTFARNSERRSFSIC